MKSNIRKTKDINEIRSELEAKYGKEKLKSNLLKSYNKQYRTKKSLLKKRKRICSVLCINLLMTLALEKTQIMYILYKCRG